MSADNDIETFDRLERCIRMRCSTLTELSPPPPDKVGCPGTEESPQLPDTMPDGCPCPG